MRLRGPMVGVVIVIGLAGLLLYWAGEIVRADDEHVASKLEREQEREKEREKTHRLVSQVRHRIPLVGLDEDQMDALAELGYADWGTTDTPGVSGVTIHDSDSAWAGLNLYKSFAAKEAHLMDMDGDVVHTWRAPDTIEGKWCHQMLLPGGDLMGIVRGRYVERVAWDSTLLWRTEIPAHHDFDVDGEGRVLVLIERVREVPVRGVVLPVMDNGIAILSPEGELLEEVWLSDLFADKILERKFISIQKHVQEQQPGHEHARGDGLDVFHTNTVEVLPRDVPGLGSAGQVLVSLRALDLVAVVDLDGPRLVWSWGEGEVDGQHQPTLLPNDHLLIFDNGDGRGWSRVIELDPLSGEIVWEYRADPTEDFFTNSRGGSERLANGNVLVTESNRGRVFEVTREGELVWEFLNPDVAHNARGTIYRLHRLTPEELASLPPIDS